MVLPRKHSLRQGDCDLGSLHGCTVCQGTLIQSVLIHKSLHSACDALLPAALLSAWPAGEDPVEHVVSAAFDGNDIVKLDYRECYTCASLTQALSAARRHAADDNCCHLALYSQACSLACGAISAGPAAELAVDASHNLPTQSPYCSTGAVGADCMELLGRSGLQSIRHLWATS